MNSNCNELLAEERGERLHEARVLSVRLRDHPAKVDLKVLIGRLTPHLAEVGKVLTQAPLDERVLPTDGVEHIAGGNFSSTAWICLLR